LKRKCLLPFLSLIIILNLSFSQVFVPKVDANSDDASFQLQFFPVLDPVDYENKTIHEGDIIVEGNGTFTVEDYEFNQAGNFIVKDNATLIIRNTTLIIYKPDYYADRYIHGITLKDQARLMIEKANLTSIRLDLAGNPFYDKIEINVMDSSKTYVTKSIIMLGIMRIYNSSSLNINDSFQASYPFSPYLMGIESYDFSVISITDSNSIGGISAFDSSSFFIDNWTFAYNSIGRKMSLNTLSIHDSSNILVTKSQITPEFTPKEVNLTIVSSFRYVNYWNLYINESVQSNFNLTLIDTEINKFNIHFYNSTLLIKDSNNFEMDAYDSNVFVRESNLTGLGGYGTSTIHVENSTFENLAFGDSTFASVKDTTVTWEISCRDESKVIIERAIVLRLIVNGEVEISNSSIYLIEMGSNYKTASLLMNDSRIARKLDCGKGAEAYILNSIISNDFPTSRVTAALDSVVWLVNSQADSLEIFDEARVYKGWYLTVTVTSNNQPLTGAYVEVYDKNKTIVAKGSTDQYGKISFVLPESIIRSGMDIEYVGDYTIKALYGDFIGEDQVILDTNKQVMMVLQPVPFIETPLGVATMSGTAIAIMIAIALILRRRKT